MKKRTKAGPATAPALPLQVLMKFRMVINTAKRQFKWVEKQCGINGAQLWALWEIERAPEMRVTGLAAALAMHQSSASNLVDKLVKAALIARNRAAHDQRVITLSLTRKGQSLLKKAPKPARGLLAEAMHGLPAGVLTDLDRSLAALLKAMKQRDRSDMIDPLALILER